MDELTPPATPDLPVTPADTNNPAVPVRRVFRRPPPRSNKLPNWLVMPFVFLLGLMAGWLMWGMPGYSTPTTVDNQVNVGQNVKRFNVPTGDNPSRGPDNAPITIIEFSDYQCPYCVRWYQEVSARLFENYKDKIRFVYRDFPLSSIHPNAQSAAEAAYCAGEQSAYWQYHDALFGEKYGLGETAYTQYATDLGLNMDQFNKCVSEHRYKSKVNANYTFGTTVGVSSTPTFFINGLAVVGAQPYEVFQQIIDKELAGEIPK